jgi:hypothetical protein
MLEAASLKTKICVQVAQFTIAFIGHIIKAQVSYREKSQEILHRIMVTSKTNSNLFKAEP